MGQVIKELEEKKTVFLNFESFLGQGWRRGIKAEFFSQFEEGGRGMEELEGKEEAVFSGERSYRKAGEMVEEDFME